MNARKINEHGRRADSIIRGMLLHSRGQSGERQETDINAVLEEYVNLSYHGMRAQDRRSTSRIERELRSPTSAPSSPCRRTSAACSSTSSTTRATRRTSKKQRLEAPGGQGYAPTLTRDDAQPAASRGGADPRQRERHPAGGPRPHLQPVLHDEADGAGHGARPVDQPRHRRAAAPRAARGRAACREQFTEFMVRLPRAARGTASAPRPAARMSSGGRDEDRGGRRRAGRAGAVRAALPARGPIRRARAALRVLRRRRAEPARAPRHRRHRPHPLGHQHARA